MDAGGGHWRRQKLSVALRARRILGVAIFVPWRRWIVVVFDCKYLQSKMA